MIVSFKNVINSDDVVKLMTLAYQQDNFKKADLDTPRTVCWIKNEEIPTLILKLSLILKIDPDILKIFV